MSDDTKHEFLMTVQRDGKSVEETWHICPRAKANDELRKMESGPMPGEQQDCPKCGTSWPMDRTGI